MRLSFAAIAAGLMAAAGMAPEQNEVVQKSKPQPTPKKSKRTQGKRTRSLKTRSKRVKAKSKAKRRA